MIFKSKTVVPFLHLPLFALEKTQALDKYLITNRVSDKTQILQVNIKSFAKGKQATLQGERATNTSMPFCDFCSLKVSSELR